MTKSGEKVQISPAISREVATELRLTDELAQLQKQINNWIEGQDGEMQELLRWQLLDRSKYFRPLTLFSCHQAISDMPASNQKMRSSVALELFHNVSLIIDDILDRSRYRRGKLTLHCRFGSLRALMAAGYIVAEGFEMIKWDPYSISLLSELLKRLGVAECIQWRLRRQPLDVEDWRQIAGEDTGSMFEICACLGTRNNALRKFGHLLGVLYHGCDDVSDVRGTAALGGGGYEDVRDGILTLPVAIAIRDPDMNALFRNPTKRNRRMLLKRMNSVLPEAEQYLDHIAKETLNEAQERAINPNPLIKLIKHTRKLSVT